MLTIPDEIKELLHRDTCKKNIRIHFPNGERSDICNDLIVMDSVSFTESLCSQNELKFGLCESPIFECEVVGVGNIKGATIEVFCEVYCDSTVTDAIWQADLMAHVYQIPYGVFVVDSCQRQADMAHRRITAYSQGNIALMGECPIVKFSSEVLWPNNTAYNPRIIPLMIMASQSTGKNPGLTYTEVTNSFDFCIPYNHVSYSSSGQRAYGVVCRAVYYNPTGDDLYYLDYDEPYLTAAQYGHGLKAEHCIGGISHTEATPSIPAVDRIKSLCNQRGKYIYPYQAEFRGYRANMDDNNYSHIIFIPYKFALLGSPYGNWGSWFPVGGIATQFRDTPKIYKVDISSLPQNRITINRENVIPSIYASYGDTPLYTWNYNSADFEKYYNGILEMGALFGRIDHENIFTFINIKRQFGLNPENTLYPGENVYPEGVNGGELLPQDYQSCWYDDKFTKPFGAIRIKYKDTNNNDSEYFYYLTGYSKGTDVNTYQIYEVSGNAIIDMYTWTEAQIEDICEDIASNIEGVSYMPVDFTGRGLPYVEAGDTFEILTASNDSITTIVLNRTISGEQVLTDSYKSV